MSTPIESRVKKVIATKTGADPDKITLTSRLYEDLGMDSLMRVEIMMNFESEFRDLKLEIPDDAAENIKTVGDVIAFVEEYMEK